MIKVNYALKFVCFFILTSVKINCEPTKYYSNKYEELKELIQTFEKKASEYKIKSTKETFSGETMKEIKQSLLVIINHCTNFTTIKMQRESDKNVSAFTKLSLLIKENSLKKYCSLSINELVAAINTQDKTSLTLNDMKNKIQSEFLSSSNTVLKPPTFFVPFQENAQTNSSLILNTTAFPNSDDFDSLFSMLDNNNQSMLPWSVADFANNLDKISNKSENISALDGDVMLLLSSSIGINQHKNVSLEATQNIVGNIFEMNTIISSLENKVNSEKTNKIVNSTAFENKTDQIIKVLQNKSNLLPVIEINTSLANDGRNNLLFSKKENETANILSKIEEKTVFQALKELNKPSETPKENFNFVSNKKLNLLNNYEEHLKESILLLVLITLCFQ